MVKWSLSNIKYHPKGGAHGPGGGGLIWGGLGLPEDARSKIWKNAIYTLQRLQQSPSGVKRRWEIPQLHEHSNGKIIEHHRMGLSSLMFKNTEG